VSRIIHGLKWARALDSRPACIPASRPRGAKAAGLRYERALARALPAAKHGQWFEFEDEHGRGYCQVDLMIQLLSGVLILEAKYTWCPEGHCQIEQLYMPVVAEAWGMPVAGLVVCKKLIPYMPGVAVAGDLDMALRHIAVGRRCALHWLGGVTLARPTLRLVA
jgi:hypothetical protein